MEKFLNTTRSTAQQNDQPHITSAKRKDSFKECAKQGKQLETTSTEGNSEQVFLGATESRSKKVWEVANTVC